MKSGTREVRMMYLESIYNLSMLEEIAPEMVRYGLLETLAELFSTSLDIEIVRLAARILDNMVSLAS
jgi:hypothetical protein